MRLLRLLAYFLKIAWLLNFLCSQTHVRSDSDHTGDGWVPTPIHQEGDQRILCGV